MNATTATAPAAATIKKEKKIKEFKSARRTGKWPLVHTYIAAQIALSRKSHKELAEEIGFKSANIISMMKTGETRVPMAKVKPIAQALNIDPFYLWCLTMAEYDPEQWEAFEGIFNNQPILTPNEIEFVHAMRESGVVNPKLKDDNDRAAFKEFLGTIGMPLEAVLALDQKEEKAKAKAEAAAKEV